MSSDKNDDPKRACVMDGLSFGSDVCAPSQQDPGDIGEISQYSRWIVSSSCEARSHPETAKSPGRSKAEVGQSKGRGAFAMEKPVTNSG